MIICQVDINTHVKRRLTGQRFARDTCLELHGRHWYWLKVERDGGAKGGKPAVVALSLTRAAMNMWM